MKKNYLPVLFLLWASWISQGLVAQNEVLLEVAPPDQDTLHFPVWPGCYSPALSEQEQYRCTRECMATLIYANLQWPPERLMDSGYVKVHIHVNQDGTVGQFRLFRETHPLLDMAVLKSMNTIMPLSKWRPAYLNSEPKNAEFVTWIKYKPGDANGNVLLFTSLEESEKFSRNTSHDCIYIADPMPVYPGGQSALLKFINDNVQLPAVPLDQIQETRLVIQFIIEANGSVSSVKIRRGIHPEIDEAYLRVFEQMPSWEPARQRGMPVRTQMNFPIRIRFE